ncbi:MAG: hypothetical protein M1378_01115 [Bacteroidetes bacterium]|jgi:hypothetical protein|nr:hypothetical protein [Bacteroidota bacterium]MCL5033994.1 hypothetical protein [Bacteroidota bacterium]
MGSSTLLDIIGSMVIGSLLLLVALKMDERATANTYQSEENLTVQQNLTSLIQNLEWDFRKLGYCKNPALTTDPSDYILNGDTNSITFVGDLENAGKLDTVTWFLGGPVPGCPNPNVRMLYRKVDNGPDVGSNLGVTEFSMEYFDTFGQPIHTPYIGGTLPSPQLIQLTVEVEPTSEYGDTTYGHMFALWRQTRLVSRNLRNR